MVSAMQVQRADEHRALQRAAKLGRRTMIGGPYASSEPEALLPLADHVVGRTGRGLPEDRSGYRGWISSQTVAKLAACSRVGKSVPSRLSSTQRRLYLFAAL